MKIIIIGLRRSGTTIFWKTLRQDSRFICYDEPFRFFPLAQEDPKKTRDEFYLLEKRSGGEFSRRHLPIQPEEEFDSEFTEPQREYLSWLLSTGENVLIDTVRCHFKVSALKEIAPDAILIHLFRNPKAVVTSHLLPSAPSRWWLQPFTKRLRRWTFWHRRTWYNNWHFEQVIDGPAQSKFDAELRRLNLNPEEIHSWPAVGKLVAFWWASYARVENDGREYFRDRFISVKFEDFCCEPALVMKRIYNVCGLSQPEFDFSNVNPAKPGYMNDSLRWQHYFSVLGLNLEK